MKGKLFNVKLTDGNSIKVEWQYEICPEEVLGSGAMRVVDYYTKKTIYIPTTSIVFISEDDTKRIGF